MMIQRTLIIAEAGVNHNGDLNLAKRLVSVAADAGADYVKFQTFKADKTATRTATKAVYQQREDSESTQFLMLKRLEMPAEWHEDLIKHATLNNIKFLSTGFDIESIDLLDSLDIDFFKIPSGEITNKPLLQHVAKKKRPVILSTGMANMQEIRDALTVLETSGLSRSDITILHCNTEYPTPFEDVNLLAMNAIQKEFDVKVGYSDHTLGIEIPIAAVSLGAKVIEKHFTTDRQLPGPDHRASLEPDELREMVRCIRNVEFALSGTGVKSVSNSESKNVQVARKSIHVARALEEGARLDASDLIMLRPGDGISPMQIDLVIGRRLKVSLPESTKLNWDHLD